MPKFIAVKDNIVKGRYYEKNQREFFDEKPSHHWEPIELHEETPETLMPETMYEEQIQSMNKAALVGFIQEQYGVTLDETKRKDELVQEALGVVQQQRDGDPDQEPV